MRKLFVLPVILAVAGLASADVLWDQSNYDVDVAAYVDQDFGDFPDYSSFLVVDVTTDPGGWNIASITGYFTGDATSPWMGITQARINIFERTGALPDNVLDDPFSGTPAGVTVTDLGDGTLAITADGLDIDLAEGDYWIGFTPMADFGVYGQEFHRGAPIIGIDTAWRNPGGAFGVGGDWGTTGLIGTDWEGAYDAAILIEGTVIPEPASLLLLALGGLLIRRR